jgi:hypothetical protein
MNLKSQISLLAFIIFLSCNRLVYYSKEAKTWESLMPPDSADLDYSVYLIGDAGDPNPITTEPVFKLLKSVIEKDTNSTTVFQ